MNGYLVVVVYFGPGLCFWNDNVVGTMIQVLKLYGAIVGGHDFGFTGTEGSLVLIDGFTCNWSIITADDKTRERA